MKRLAVALVLVLMGVSVSAQTLGYKHPGADPVKETWKINIPVGDSISTYFIVPPHVDKVTAHFDNMEAGGVFFSVAVDTAKVSGGRVLSDFTYLYTFSAVLDSIVSITGNLTVDITERVRGAAAVRFKVGSTAVTQGVAVGIYVFIRKKPPS